MTRRTLGLIAIFLLALIPHASPAALVPENPSAKLVREADALYRGRDDLMLAQRACDIYQDLAANQANDPEILWRASMATYFLAHRRGLEGDAAEREFAKGHAYGQRALHTAPDCAPCNFWTAINLALLTNAKGKLASLRALKEVRGLLRRAQEIDARYAGAGPSRVLGIIHTKIPRLIGGDPFEARRLFREAITLAPAEALNYLELARLEADFFEDRESARKVASEGLRHAPISPIDIESADARRALVDIHRSLTKL